MGRALGQEIPGGVREGSKSNKKKCWCKMAKETTLLQETQSRLSTFPSGIFALGCGPPGPLWRLDRLTRNPSHLIPSNKTSLRNYAERRNWSCRKLV